MEQHNQTYIGLTDQEVETSRIKYGINILTPPKKVPWWKLFLEKFSDPLIIILLIAGALSIGISCYEFWGLNQSGSVFFEPLGIFIAVLLATGLSFIFEQRSDKAFSILNQVNDDELYRVIRNGNTIQVAKKDIVVGDIVVLGTGEEIPADARLLESVSLQVDESTLTGELICAKTTLLEEMDKNATYASNCIMRGTKIMEGHCICQVTAVGDKTENGKVFEAAQIDDSVKTPLNEQLDRLGDLITNVSYIFAAAIIIGKLLLFFGWNPWAFTLLIPVAIFFYLVIKKFGDFSKTAIISTLVIFFVVFIGLVVMLHNYIMPDQDMTILLSYTLQTLMIAVTLIVVAVPEGLPMAVTLSLAYSMQRMLKTNNLVRKMHACETMGAATVICTDKTGTLTKNQMRIHQTQFCGLNNQKLGTDEMSYLIEENMAINSTASLDLSDSSHPSALGSPTEGALLLWLWDNGINYQELRNQAHRIEELPFTTNNKYIATVVESPHLHKKVLYLNGAPEIVKSLCTATVNHVNDETITNQLIEFQNKAMRTLGFAYQILDDNDKIFENGKVVAERLTFMGVVAISDPVRDDVPNAVFECLNAGIDVKIVTGDSLGTAKEIGRQIGLLSPTDGDECIITGPEFDTLSDKELQERVKTIKIISRAKPLHKKRLVEALQANNEVVSVTGDGTNDAPALKAAHVGLSMGAGTSVAKEASDITIIDNSFSSIGRAVMWGRSLYQNIQRFILFQMTVNVAACFIVLAGAFMGMESPLTVTQMLWVNLIMDTFAAMALASLPPSEKVMNDKPRNRESFIINKQMAWNIILTGGIFFIVLMLILKIFLTSDITSLSDLMSINLGQALIGHNGHLTPYELSLFFTIFVMLQFWNMFNSRAFETGRSAFHFKGCRGFGVIIALILVGQILIVEFGGKMFNVTPLSIHDWFWIIISTLSVLVIGEVIRLVNRLLCK